MSFKVFCRARPPSSSLLTVRNNGVSAKSHSFDFDAVFNENSTQREVYDQVADPLIGPTMSGQSGCVILFGPTE